jgi:hypothetical protein
MSLIRLNQLHTEILAKVDEKDVAIKQQIETTLQYTVGPTAPSSPSIGYRWFDTASSLMKVWNGVGAGADWEITNANAIYLPGRNAIDSASSAMKQITTGSGFLEFGGRIKSPKTVNRALLANSGIPRLAGIVGEGDAGIKKFWFENFFLLNANGYTEETLDPSTGEISTILVDGIPVSLQGTLPNTSVINSKKLMAVNLPEAPKTTSELNRDEIVFLEVWREKISDSGYVFPYGNVQFTGDDADGIKTSQYKGDVGYCASFKGDNVSITAADSNGVLTTTEQPKGKGWVWRDIQTSQKNTIAANYKHNIYVDGDNLVQIRYRIRVSTFSNLPATPLTNTTVLGYTADNDSTTFIRAQGKLSALNTTDNNYKILAPFNLDNIHSLNGTYSTKYVSDLSHDGFVFASPLVVVSRRNQGVFDTIFNPNGSARFRDGLRLVADYDASDDIIGFALMDKENATLASSTTGSTWAEKYKIMMTWLFDRKTILTAYDNAQGFVIGGDMNSGISGRYDGLYYDEVNEADVNDLRVDINKQLDLTYVLEKEFNKFILGEQRGWNQENHLYYWTGNVGTNAKAEYLDATGKRQPLMSGGKQVTGYGYVTELPIYYKMANSSIINGIDTDIATKITAGYTSTISIRSGNRIDPQTSVARTLFSDKFFKRVQVSLEPVLDAAGNTQNDINGNLVQKIVIHDGEVYVDEKTEIVLISPKGRTSRKTQLHADIIGDPAGNSYKFTTSTKVLNLPDNVVLENGNIVFSGQNYFVYKGIRKIKSLIDKDPSGNFKIDESNTNDWLNVTGKGGYSEGWKMYGNLGSSLLVDEEGISTLPRDVVSGIDLGDGTGLVKKNTKFFKLSKPAKTISKVMVTTDKKAGKRAFLTQITSTKDVTVGGVTTTQSILDQVDATPSTFAYENSVTLTNNNMIAINWSAFTDDAIIEIYYEVDSNPTTITSSTRVEMLGDIWVGNSLYHNLGCKSISNLINKVPTYNAAQSSKGAAKRIPLSTYLVNKGDDGAILNSQWSVINHAPVDLSGTGPAIKMLPYITSVRGEMFLKVLYKELDKSVSLGKAYTKDNSSFTVLDGETTTDMGVDKGTLIKIGQRKIRLPYYFGDVV